jgi:hypothetical protein
MRWNARGTIIATLIAIGVCAPAASAATQPFSAPLWAIHHKKFRMWHVGTQASNGVALIAEDALAAPLSALLEKDDKNVLGQAVALPPITDPVTPPPIPPGKTREFDIGTQGKFDRVSMIWMLVRSNDAFSGLDSLHLGANNGKKGKKSNARSLKNKNVTVNAYDAGTEKNNENGDFVPGPPFNHFFVRDPDAQFIAPHPGLTAGLAEYAWTDPVARIEITRIK